MIGWKSEGEGGRGEYEISEGTPRNGGRRRARVLGREGDEERVNELRSHNFPSLICLGM